MEHRKKFGVFSLPAGANQDQLRSGTAWAGMLPDWSTIDERLGFLLPSDELVDADVIAASLKFRGAPANCVVFYENVAMGSEVPLNQGVEMVLHAKTAAVASCLAGQLAYYRDSHGVQGILDRRLFTSTVVRWPFRVLGALLGPLMILSGLSFTAFGAVDLFRDPWQLEVWGLVLVFASSVPVGILVIKATLSGRDPLAARR